MLNVSKIIFVKFVNYHTNYLKVEANVFTAQITIAKPVQKIITVKNAIQDFQFQQIIPNVKNN